MLRLFDLWRTPTGRLTRRAWMACSTLPLLAGHRRLLHARDSSTSPASGRAKSVLFIVANGGPSQLETFDPKPLAPAEIRGEFSAISTALPGVSFCEHLPRLAKMADQFSIVRSMSHADLDHGSALYLTLTGQYHSRLSSNPAPSPLDRPTLGSLVKTLQPTNRFVQTAIHVNGPALIPIHVGAGQNGGFLGPEADPLVLGDVTAMTSPVPELAPLPELSLVRLDRRRSLRANLERQLTWGEGSRSVRYDEHDRRAWDMLHDPRVRTAFDLEAERESLRDRFGRDRSGQACLIARRLVEAGVPWTTVFWNHTGRGQDLAPDITTEYGWDTHNDIFDAMKQRLLPRFDQSLSALLTDMGERGLLETTLVVVAGEFGRAPLIARERNFAGTSPGRKHWSACYSVLCAGAGTLPGKIIGSSDSQAAYPTSQSYGPWDLAATLLSALGIDPEQRFDDALGRTHAVVEGHPIAALYEN